jgi:hypothetical protein
MPTYDVFASFWRDWRSLTPQQQLAFMRALEQFKADLRSGALRPGLPIKRVQRHPGVWEITWAADGRATFEHGRRSGASHTSAGAGSELTTSFAARD